MVDIKNLCKEKPLNKYDIKIDRSSILGNPFNMRNEAQRNTVCNQYEEYFNDKMFNDKTFTDEVNKLLEIYRLYGKLNLFCWCTPRRCHAETIKKYILSLV